MDVKKCDKCGAYFKETNLGVQISAVDEGVRLTGDTIWKCKPGIHVTIKPITKSPYLKKRYDLCPECAEKLQRFLLNEDPDIVDILTKKPDKTLSESLEEKLALPVEGAPNGPATDCKYCGVRVNGRKDIRACINPFIISHTLCTYKCTKFEPKEKTNE